MLTCYYKANGEKSIYQTWAFCWVNSFWIISPVINIQWWIFKPWANLYESTSLVHWDERWAETPAFLLQVSELNMTQQAEKGREGEPAVKRSEQLMTPSIQHGSWPVWVLAGSGRNRLHEGPSSSHLIRPMTRPDIAAPPRHSDPSRVAASGNRSWPDECGVAVSTLSACWWLHPSNVTPPSEDRVGSRWVTAREKRHLKMTQLRTGSDPTVFNQQLLEAWLHTGKVPGSPALCKLPCLPVAMVINSLLCFCMFSSSAQFVLDLWTPNCDLTSTGERRDFMELKRTLLFPWDSMKVILKSDHDHTDKYQ